MTNVPIVLFAYNRLFHLQRTIDSLKSAKDFHHYDLIVFSDGPKNLKNDIEFVSGVREFINGINEFRSVTVHKRANNYGLAKNVIEGLNSVFTEYPAAIVIEDDIEVSSDFLILMSQLLSKYALDKKVGSVSGYLYPIRSMKISEDFFLLPRASSWGWATWKDRWEDVDWHVEDFESFLKSKELQNEFNRGGEDLSPMLIKWKFGLNNSWAVRWTYHQYKMGMYGLFPKYNLVNNHGNDGSGTHSPKTKKYAEKMHQHGQVKFPDVPEVNLEAVEELQKFFRLSVVRKLINWALFKYLMLKK